MRIRYLDGVKVCVIECRFNKYVDIYNYSDVVLALNALFRQAHISAEGTGEHSLKTGDNMNFLLRDLAEICNIPIKTISTRESKVIYDNENIIKKAREPRLQLPRCNAPLAGSYGLKIIKGGKTDQREMK